ncbi:TPR end-of-group domain-containing protein [Sphaerotilus sp.]|uniref:TPR end-of-group domain-containing protein n=1 Tax=Sphaerotilus sp. TaxID=2093942 RepID=UPI0025D80A37|nr:hypothetical protein [Sphaerotilus sp.]
MNRVETRTLRDVAASLRQADGECVVLMGAGCSKSAGIPLAGELIQEVRKSYPEAFRRASEGGKTPDYNGLMDQLSPREREKLLLKHIKSAQLNWAHLALAQLFAHDKIDRVLTVNFDPLLVKACAMVNFFPAIYDLAGSDQFKPRRIAPYSIFFLNGQHTGFSMLNGADELDAHRGKLSRIVENTGVSRVWLVVGYSGEADPLLDVLASQSCFDGDLYWLGLTEQPSERQAQSGIFQRGRHAFYVGGQDADVCLTDLASNLECFPPDFLVRPFEYLKNLVDPVRFETGGPVAVGLRDRLFAQLNTAAKAEESGDQQDISKVEGWLLSGQPDRVIKWFKQLPEPNSDAIDLAAWAYIDDGNLFADRASKSCAKDLDHARALWGKAGERYSLALSLNADKHAAAYNWGNVLDNEAEAIKDADLPAARGLWTKAGEKYALALSLKADRHKAANNWGFSLSKEADAIKDSDLPAARALWAKAGEKYALALSLKVDAHEAANNWGVALSKEAEAIKDADLPAARGLWAKAGEKYALALSLKVDDHKAANNWGTALTKEAEAIKDADLPAARALWAKVGEKYALALSLKSDDHDAANNLGSALVKEYHALVGADLSEALAVLSRAASILEEQKAINIQAHAIVAYNLACVYSLQGKSELAISELDACINAGTLADHWVSDPDLNSIRGSERFQVWMEKNFPGIATSLT